MNEAVQLVHGRFHALLIALPLVVVQAVADQSPGQPGLRGRLRRDAPWRPILRIAVDEPVEPGDEVLNIFDGGGADGRFLQFHAHSTEKGPRTLCHGARNQTEISEGGGVSAPLTAIEGIEDLVEHGLLAIAQGKQGHAGLQFHVVRSAEDLRRRLVGVSQQQSRAFDEAGAEYRVLQVFAGLLNRSQCESLRHRAAAESRDLGKDEPHPMDSFLPACSSARNAS